MTDRTGIPFVKLETVGNDFVLIERDSYPGGDWHVVAEQVCARRVSVGSDGLLVIWRDGDEIHLRFFNPDGTEDFCGNGLRCAAWFAYRRGWVGREFLIHQLGKKIGMEVDPVGRVKAKMPAASFLAGDVPTVYNGEMWERPVAGVVGSAVSTGSAHFIVFCAELPGDAEFFELGPRIENDPVFPERISVMWVRAESDRRLEMRIWERGVGETMGCGTGATAAASVWFRKTGLSGSVEVVSRGGVLAIEMASWDAPMSVECDPEELFSGVVWVTSSTLVGR